MSKLFRKKIFIAISSVAMIILAMFVLCAPTAKAAAYKAYKELTLQDILDTEISPQRSGSKDVWDWTGMKSKTTSNFTVDSSFSRFGIQARSTTDNKMKLLSKVEYMFTINTTGTIQVDYGWDDYEQSYSSGSNSGSFILNDMDETEIQIYINIPSDAVISGFNMKLYYADTFSASVTAGSGIKEVYLSHLDNGRKRHEDSYSFKDGATVYSYVGVNYGYVADSSWVYMFDTFDDDYNQMSVYRVGSKKISGAAINFGTITADPVTRTFTLDNNGGTGSGTVDLTYGQAAQIPGTGFSRELFTLDGWNTKADGSGKSYTTNLSVDNVNEILTERDYDTGEYISTLYAKWKINAAGVETLINNIGAIEFTSASRGRIKEARAGYDSLSEEEKAQVDNRDLLLAAEDIFNALFERYAEAQIGNTLYAFLPEAFDALNAGDTITLRHDVDLSNEHIIIDKNLTIDLNGHILKTTMDNASSGTPTLFVTTNNTVVEIRNSEPSTGGVDGLCIIDNNTTNSYVKLNDCRLLFPAEMIINDLGDANKVGPGYEIEDINSDGSPDENGFISIVKPLDVFDISNLDENYIVPDGQILTGELQRLVKISILDGATVTLKDIDINGSNTEGSFAGITCLGDATLIIKGNNDICGFNGGAGIFVPEGHTLTIDGDGILYSDGRDGAAGIGGNANTNSGNIIINGGDINADGGANAAGIGGGYSEDNDLQSGNITINGGRINSTTTDGAGIGSAVGEACGDITINGGFVEARSSWSSSTGNCGSGIGSGKDGSCGDVTITDNVALVRATARDNEKEIGGNCASLDIANTLTFERIYESIYYSHKNTVIIDGQVVNDSHSSGEGWSYDKATNTLTLDGYVYEGPGKVYSNFVNHGGVFIAAISYDGEDDFTINLVGENTIVVTQDDSPLTVCGIHSAGNESAKIIFTGKGSLSISLTGENTKSYAIASGSTITIDGPIIEANAGKAIDFSAGVYLYNDVLDMISGSLYADGEECSDVNGLSYGICTDNEDITIGENVRTLIASGYSNAIYANVINAIEGIGWTDVDGTQGETKIEISPTGVDNIGDYKYISFIGITPEDVIAFINDIGDVEYTNLCKEKIDKARDAYNFLKDEEKTIVTNYDTLLAAEENYGKVDEVVGKINAIGDVEYTPESKALIDAARSAYDALTDFQKSLVPNYDTLVAKEAEYKALDDQHHADEVENVINAIGEVKYTPESKALIDAARTAFDALNDEAKELVENKAVLLAAENVYATMDLINSLDSVKYNSKSKALIEKAKELYNELTDSEKELITNYNGLVKADDDYKAVDKVVKEISNLGKITYDEASLNKINNAKKSKSALSTDQQKMFPSNATEVLKDYEVAYDTLETFNSIGEVEYTKEYEKELADARVKYNSLTDDQKKLIDDTDLKLLTDKENQFKSTEKAATIWGVILLILSIVALGSGCYFLFLVLRKKDEDDEKKDNTVKATSSVLPLVILTSYFATGPYLAFYIIISLAVAVWAAVLVIYLLKKKGIMMASNTNTEVEAENIPEVEETETEPTEEVTLAEEKEETQETQPENPTDDNEESDEEQVVETTTDASGNIFKIQYISSFTAKLIQSSDELKRQYSELRKEILSYSGTKSKTTWHFDTISYGRTVILRFGIRGKTLCVYYALNYEDFENSKYKLENVTSKKHSSAPCLYRIKNDRRFDYAKELIEIIAKKYDLIKEEKEIEDVMPPYEDRDTLVSKGLIKKLEVKLTSNDKKITEITVDEANKAMSNDAALGCVITDNDSKIHEGKKEVVNVSVLEEQYNDGDTVNIESLIEKGIINSKVGYVKLLAGGKLDKKLNVELQDYSIEAVKMIILLGGTVKKVR